MVHRFLSNQVFLANVIGTQQCQVFPNSVQSQKLLVHSIQEIILLENNQDMPYAYAFVG